MVTVEINRLALNVFHDEIGQAVIGAAAIEQAGDVGVIERGEDLALTAKSLNDIVGVQATADNLYGNEFFECVIGSGRQIYCSHSAVADLPQHAIDPDPAALIKSAIKLFQYLDPVFES